VSTKLGIAEIVYPFLEQAYASRLATRIQDHRLPELK